MHAPTELSVLGGMSIMISRTLSESGVPRHAGSSGTAGVTGGSGTRGICRGLAGSRSVTGCVTDSGVTGCVNGSSVTRLGHGYYSLSSPGTGTGCNSQYLEAGQPGTGAGCEARPVSMNFIKSGTPALPGCSRQFENGMQAARRQQRSQSVSRVGHS